MSKKSKKSIVDWEDSMFGGYKNLLWDHPDISIDSDVDWEADDELKEELGYYRFRKLIKLFLLLSKEKMLTPSYTYGAKKEKITRWFSTYTRYHLNRTAVATGVDILAASDHELANLFGKLGALIKETDIYYDVQDKEKKGKGGKSGEGEKEGEDEEEGDGDGEGASEEGDGKISAEEMQKFINAMLDVTENKPYYSSHDDIGWSGNTRSFDNIKFRIMPTSPTPCAYTDKEILQAGQLVNLLDISFDPKPDKIDSLTSGKLEPMKICEVPCGNLSVYYRMEENVSTKPFSVCVLLDESSSMGNSSSAGCKMEVAVRMTKVLYKAFSQILPQDKLFFYGHTGEANPAPDGMHPDIPVVRVYHDPYNQNFEKSISSAGLNTHQNYDGPIIQAVYDKVRSFTEDNIIFLVVSDGEPAGSSYGGPQAINDLKRIVEKCKRGGFATGGIGVQHNGVKGIYPYNCVIRDINKDFTKKTSMLVNHIVKTEFQ